MAPITNTWVYSQVSHSLDGIQIHAVSFFRYGSNG